MGISVLSDSLLGHVGGLLAADLGQQLLSAVSENLGAEFGAEAFSIVLGTTDGGVDVFLAIQADQTGSEGELVAV